MAKIVIKFISVLHLETEDNAMYEFEHEIKRKEKIFKTYVILFSVSALINLVLFFMDRELLRGTSNLLIYFIVMRLWFT